MINEEQIKAMDETAAFAVAQPAQAAQPMVRLNITGEKVYDMVYPAYDTRQFSNLSNQAHGFAQNAAIAVEDKPIDLTAHPFPLPKKLIDMGYTEEELEKDNPYNPAFGVMVKSAREVGTMIEMHPEVLPTKPESTVIYHGNCADGFCAALAFWLKYGSTMEYYAGVYNDAPPDVEGRVVYMVDFSYKRDVVLEMLKKAEKVYFIDHHKTAIEDLADLSDANSELFRGNFIPYTDLNRSGAMLAWDFIHNTRWNSFGFTHELQKEDPEYMSAPKLFHYVQDRDLWQKKLPRTNEFNANLFSYNYDFVGWAGIMSDVESVVGFTHFCMAGEAILRKQQKDINELLKVTKRTLWFHEADAHAPCACMPYTLSSEAGHQMLTEDATAPFAACYWDTETHRIFSLRSNDDRMDVSEIAKLYGGGGHRNAAGFRVPRTHILAEM